MTTDRRQFLTGLTIALASPAILFAQTDVPSPAPYDSWMKVKIGRYQHYTLLVQVAAGTKPAELIAALLKENTDAANVINIKSKDLVPVQTFTAKEVLQIKPSKYRLFQVMENGNGRSFAGTVRLDKHNIIDFVDGTVTTEKGTVHINIAIGGYFVKPHTYDTSVPSEFGQPSDNEGFRLSDLKKLFHHDQPNPQ